MVAATPPIGPLSPAQLQEVAAANNRAHKIRKAAGVARFNGWTIGIIAACSAPFALFSLSGLMVAAGLGLVAYNEFQGRRRLLRFDPNAPTFLGWNQVGFLTLIVVYCVWMLFAGLTGAGPFAAEIKANPELRSVLGSNGELEQISRLVTVAVYGTVIVLSAVFQGGNAIYYFSRRKYIEAYLQETPGWVLDLQRASSPT